MATGLIGLCTRKERSENMHPEVIAAFINFLGTIIAAIIAFVSVILV